ncbi:hypothetical protein ACFE04_007096 [Oxalis oulophora]
MGGFVFLFYRLIRPSRIRPSTVCSYRAFERRYNDSGKSGSDHAPSLADEFRKLQEEKEEAVRVEKVGREQGIASQSSDKAFSAMEEQVYEGGNVESAKERYKKKHSDVNNYGNE